MAFGLGGLVNNTIGSINNTIGSVNNAIGSVNNAIGTVNTVLNNAIKPISPIKIDLGGVTEKLNSVINDQFSSIPLSLISNISNALNVNTTGAGGSGIYATGLSSSVNTMPNPLSDYVNYTYHIRLSMSNEIQAYNNINQSKPNTNTLNKIVIAESGVTAGFNISSLKTSAAASGNGSKRNMWSNTYYEMVIKEPLGLQLLDKLYYSAKELGVLNHLRCPYFLEIWFNGYDENGNIAAPNLYYSLNRVTIISMDAVSDHVGTTYTVKMYNDNAFAETNALATPPAGLSITATTLGEFFEKLERDWNDLQSNINQDGLRRNNYRIVIPNDWKTWTLRNPDVFKQNARNTPMSAELNGPQTTIQIARGQSIEKIVDFAVYLCQEAQRWITGEDSPSPGAASLKTQGIIRYVTVYPSVKINTSQIQDPVTLDYVRDITYTLIPTESVRAYTDMQTVKNIQSATTQKNKLNYLISTKRLAKKYEYIYTGRNTEVLKFDFNLSNLWTIYQPTWIQSNSYDQYTFGAIADQNSIGYQLIKGVFNRTQILPTSLIQALDSTILGTVSNTINTVTDTINSFQTKLLEEENRLISNLNAQISRATNNIVSINIPSTSSDPTKIFSGSMINLNLNVGDITKSTIAAIESQFTPQILSPLTTRQQELSTKYAEDARPPKVQSILPVVGQFDPTPTQQQARQNTDQNKIGASQDPNSFLPGTGLVGSILGNVFNDDAFQYIQLDIRGDPWWIPIGNIVQNSLAETLAGRNVVSNNSLPSDTAFFLGGDNEILLEFRMGVVINEDTGLAVTDQNGADFFTGLYQVIQVENTFSRGKFTQNLKCVRDILAAGTNTSQVANSPPAASSAGYGVGAVSGGDTRMGTASSGLPPISTSPRIGPQ